MDGRQNIEIRESAGSDIAALAELYPDAFPDEDLLPLVEALLRKETGVLSLVAAEANRVVGHVMFSLGTVDGYDGRAALLGPLGAATARHGKGIGSALVRAGLRRLEDDGVTTVVVLGDPAYYGRFGFLPEPDVMPPYELPPEWSGAWQSLRLRDAAQPLEGTLRLPEPWLQPALWLP